MNPEEPSLLEVSVAIATRDRPRLIVRLLDALEGGDALPREIVIVDQSRAPDTRERLRNRPSRSRIVYVSDERSGLGIAQNRAFATATCELVAVTDDDCVPSPEWLATVVSAFDDARLAAVTGRVLALAYERPGLVPVALRPSPFPKTFAGKTLPWRVGSGNNFAVRKAWLARVGGGNDERLGPGTRGRGSVDTDLFYRLLRAGGAIRYEPRALVFHEQAPEHDALVRANLYGYGVGAACVLRARERDAYTVWILGCWLAWRARRLLGGIARRDWRSAHEETIVFASTLQGVPYGLRARAASPGSEPVQKSTKIGRLE